MTTTCQVILHYGIERKYNDHIFVPLCGAVLTRRRVIYSEDMNEALNERSEYCQDCLKELERATIKFPTLRGHDPLKRCMLVYDCSTKKSVDKASGRP